MRKNTNTVVETTAVTAASVPVAAGLPGATTVAYVVLAATVATPTVKIAVK